MDFVKRSLLFYMIFCAALSYADINLMQESEACIVQYLKQKGKLSRSFRSSILPPSKCRVIMPVAVQELKSNTKFQLDKELPNEATCLYDEYVNKEAVDYLLKIDAIESSSFLGVNAKTTKLEKTRNQLKNLLEEIALQCLADAKNFIKIFNENLGIKNETLAAYQSEYCMAKFAVEDNKILELNNVEINPHHIEIDSVNCEYLIDVERSQAEKELSERLSATEAGRRSSDCVMDAFRNGNILNYRIASKVLANLDITDQQKERETNKIVWKISEFGMTAYACTMG